MQYRVIACVSLAFVVSVLGQTTCSGRFSTEYDLWCQSSCNNQPPFCPDAFCQCTGTGGPSTTACRAIGPFSFMNDAWCTLNCNHNPPFCPEEHCSCAPPSPPAAATTINAHENTCCQEDENIIFYSNGNVIFKQNEGQVPEVCYDFPIGEPTGFAIDTEGNLYVADRISGTVSRMSVDCNDTSVEIVTSWIRDGVIDRPTAIAIVPGHGLLVSGTVGIYDITFGTDGNVFSITRIPNIIFNVRDIEVVGRTAYFIHREAEVLMLNLDTNEVTTYLAVHQHNIPDYGGITVNDCGFFFTATDSNQVFYCPDITNSTVCERYCVTDPTIDGFSCVNTNNPTGISSGCCCDIYVTNAGNGCLVHYENSGLVDFSVLGPQVGDALRCDLNLPQAVIFYNPPRPSGSLCTNACVPTPPPTPSTTPSSSRTPSATASNTASSSSSPSSSPSASPSASSSPSPSASASPSSSPSSSPSPSPSASSSPSSSASPSPSASASPSSSPSASSSASSSASASPTPSPTGTPSSSASSSSSSTPSASASASASPSSSSTPSSSQTSSSSPSASASSSSTRSASSSSTPSSSPSPSASSSPSSSSSPSPSSSSSPSASPSPSPSSSSSPSSSPSPTPSSSPSVSSTGSPTPSASPSSSASRTPSSSASPSSTPTPSSSPSASPSSSPTASASATPSSSSTPSSSRSVSASASPSSSSSPSPTRSTTVSPTRSSSASASASPTPSPTRRLGRLVPGVNLQGSGGFTQAGLLTGTATISFVLCDVGIPLFLCSPNADNSNTFRIPVNRLDTVSNVDEAFRSTTLPVFIQAVSRLGGGGTGAFNPSCLFHAIPIYHNGVSPVACADGCFDNPSVGIPQLASACTNLITIPTEEARDRTRAAMNTAATALGLTFNAFVNNSVPSTLFQSASTDICADDVIAEFSVSLLQMATGQAIDVTILSQPRFDIADRCNAAKTRSNRLCFNTTAYVNTLFDGVPIGDERGYVCISEFQVEASDAIAGGELRPQRFRAADTVLKILVGDIIDASFSVSSRSSGCPTSIPSALCAASSRRLCHINECP